MIDPGYAFSLAQSLGVSALVAAIVTFFFNRRLEKHRGKREINTRTFETARDSVRKFAEISSVYWVRDWSQNETEEETRIILLQEDVLIDVAAALEITEGNLHSEIEGALDELIRAGTGGQFQTGSARKSDLGRARRIPGIASRLRKALIGARRALLNRRGY